MQMKKTVMLIGTTAAVAVAIAVTMKTKPLIDQNGISNPMNSEGSLSVAQIEVGPFDIHRKYRSMEGPYVSSTFKVGDMVASKRIELPEPMVTFVESEGAAPSMQGGRTKTDQPARPRHLLHSARSKSLYWVKGIKLQVLDENDKPLPTAEFICHLNVDVDPRQQVFNSAENSATRLFTLTQGQTNFHFPEGFAVPVSSNELWNFTFQAANRTTDKHRRVKQLCTIDFIKDSDLKKPLKALSWYAPYIAVVTDKASQELARHHHGPSCMMVSNGSNAPNMVPGSTLKDSQGRTLNGHWAVPPGVHSYTSPITNERDAGFAERDRRIHAVWTHIHPMCTEASLVMCDQTKKTPLFSVKADTKTDNGLEITHIDNICSEEGILLKAGKHYELNATYKNVTKETQDSMVVNGIFFEDDKFVKPQWADIQQPQVATDLPAEGTTQAAAGAGSDGSAAAARSHVASVNDYNGTDRYPLFDESKDGPVLTNRKYLEVSTSQGKLHMVLDPGMAPETATQIYRLFTSKAFDGTPVFRYQPGYILQVSSVEMKKDRQTQLAEAIFEKLRRLPLEIESQETGRALHKKWVLTMARSAAEDSGVSSFSILLADAPHLDHHFTAFGYLVPDQTTTATIDKIVKHWSNKQVYIASARPDSHMDISAAAKLAALFNKGAHHACKDGLYCGIKPMQPGTQPESGSGSKSTAKVAAASSSSSTAQAASETHPTFNAKADGPMLSGTRRLELRTSAGNIDIVLDPSKAPANATQMYRLFKSGAFDGTVITRYEPNFVLQTALAETKHDRAERMPQKLEAMLRKLPLEVASSGKAMHAHKRFALSMAHGDDPNSAVSSFSILLGDAPHLDGKYTVFGYAMDDKETERTLAYIASHWSAERPYILSVKETGEHRPATVASR